MKVLIVFGTKSGTTESCALYLSDKIKGEVTVCDLGKKKKLKVGEYDVIIIGSPIYAGMINTKVKQLCQKEAITLLDKKIAFFTCGLSNEEEALALLSKQVSASLIEKALIISHFGGELRPERLGFFMRFIVKQMSKNKTIKAQIDNTKMDKFIEHINKAIMKRG